MNGTLKELQVGQKVKEQDCIEQTCCIYKSEEVECPKKLYIPKHLQ